MCPNPSNTPVVSIACITYNHEKYIRDAIEGFLIQKTDFPIEIIIHDDASTDGTAQIIKEYEEKYPDLIFPIYQKENQYSQGKRRILATFVFPRTRGKYIALCEGDDYWTDPYKLQKQVDYLEGHQEYALCHHNAIIIDESGNLKATSYLPEEAKRDLSEDEVIKGAWILTLTVCFRNILGTMPPEISRVINGDTFLFSLLGNYGRSGYLGNEISPAVYRHHPGGVWSTLSVMEASSKKLPTYYWLGEYYKRIGKAQYYQYFSSKYRKMLLKQLERSIRNHNVRFALMAWREFISKPDNLKNEKFFLDFVSCFVKTTTRSIIS